MVGAVNSWLEKKFLPFTLWDPWQPKEAKLRRHPEFAVCPDNRVALFKSSVDFCVLLFFLWPENYLCHTVSETELKHLYPGRTYCCMVLAAVTMQESPHQPWSFWPPLISVLNSSICDICLKTGFFLFTVQSETITSLKVLFSVSVFSLKLILFVYISVWDWICRSFVPAWLLSEMHPQVGTRCFHAEIPLWRGCVLFWGVWWWSGMGWVGNATPLKSFQSRIDDTSQQMCFLTARWLNWKKGLMILVYGRTRARSTCIPFFPSILKGVKCTSRSVLFLWLRSMPHLWN